MVEIGQWMEGYVSTVESVFGDRAVFIGLQGSYGRGEPTESSDIDVVLILDRLGPADLEAYSALTAGLPHRELLCGFLSGWEELCAWTPAELFQFYHDTTPWKGSLEALAAGLDAAAPEAVRSGACALYHACVHNLLHEKDAGMLCELYKSAAFTVQAVHFCRTGDYIRRRDGLLSAIAAPERAILETGIALRSGGPLAESFIELSNRLLTWAQGLLCEAGAPQG